MSSPKSDQNINYIYVGESLDNICLTEPVVYLHGPRLATNGLSWRKRLIPSFISCGFYGTVIFPEPKDNKTVYNYETEEFYKWEQNAMEKSLYIIFWLPRKSKLFRGKNINDRFGYWKSKRPHNVVLGIPGQSEDITYQVWYSNFANIQRVSYPENAIQWVTEMIKQLDNMEINPDPETHDWQLPPDEKLISNHNLTYLIRKNISLLENGNECQTLTFNLNNYSQEIFNLLSEYFDLEFLKFNNEENQIVFRKKNKNV